VIPPKNSLLLSLTLSVVVNTSLFAQDATLNGMFNALRCKPASALVCGPIAANQVENNNVPVEVNHCIQISMPGLPEAGYYPNNSDTKLPGFVLDLKNRIHLAYVLHVGNPISREGSVACLVNDGFCRTTVIQTSITLVEVSPPVLNSQLIVEFTFLEDGGTSYGTVNILPRVSYNRPDIPIYFSIVRATDISSKQSEIIHGTCENLH
jgi:hypothetical protein